MVAAALDTYHVAADTLLSRMQLTAAQEAEFTRLSAHYMPNAVAYLLDLLSAKTRFAKPRVSINADGSATVRFCEAHTFTIYQAPGTDYRADKGTWLVSRDSAGGTWSNLDLVRGQQSREEAYKFARASLISPAPWGTLEQVHALARECEGDRGLLVKTIKRIAKQRFGAKLKVRGSTGTGYSWVSIRARDGGAEELAALKVLAGHWTTDAQVTPCRGDRLATICTLAGQPWPEGHKVAERDWD